MGVSEGVQFALLTGACRWLTHAASELVEAYRLVRTPKKPADRAEGRRKMLLLLANGVLPVAGAFAAPIHLVPDGGWIWALIEGLAAAALIAGIHNYRKAERRINEGTLALHEKQLEAAEALQNAHRPYGDARPTWNDSQPQEDLTLPGEEP